MPDPISIISLADTAFGLGCKIYAFFSAMKDAPKEIHAFAKELGVFNAVLEEVKKYIQAFTVSSFATEDALTLEIVEITLKQCETEFQDIYDAIKIQDEKLSYSMLRKLGSSTAWVFNIDERDKSTQRISRARANLETALSSMHGRQHIVVREEMKFARKDITEMKESQQNLIFLVRSMFMAGQERVKSLESRAERENIKSEIRLSDLSDKLQDDFTPTASIPDRESLDNPSQTAVSENEKSTKSDEESITPEELSDKPLGNRSQVDNLTDAFDRFRDQLPPKTLKELESYMINGPIGKLNLQGSVDEMMKWDKKLQVKAARVPLKAFLASISHMNKISDVLAQTNPAFTSIIWGSISIILQGSSNFHDSFEDLMGMLEEISETMESCRREYELYPNTRIKGLIEKLYLGLIEFCQQSLKLIQASSLKRASLEILGAGATRQEFQNSISNIRKISASVMREVEYLNRVELREAHARLRNMERDQQRMLLAMEDQKKIVLSLKEERKITTMISDQQTILQTVQNLQMKVSALDPAFFVLRGNE